MANLINLCKNKTKFLNYYFINKNILMDFLLSSIYISSMYIPVLAQPGYIHTTH